jgi:putative hydrolase of the HAD superfamily
MTTDLIFDCFGTLVGYPTGPVHSDMYQGTHGLLHALDFAIPYETFVTEFACIYEAFEQAAQRSRAEFHFDEVWSAFFARCFARVPAPHVVARCSESYINEWCRGIVTYPEHAALLARLAARYRLSVISNAHYPSLVGRTLTASGLAPYFAQVVTSIEMGICKPHPQIFMHALDQLGVAAAAAVYVGDSFTHDYQGASAVGLRCILVDPRGHHAGQVAHRVARLVEIEASLDHDPAFS